MNEYKHAGEVLRTLFEDGNVHHISEVKKVLKENGIDYEKKNNIVSNILYKMKKDGYIMMGENRGEYVIKDRETEPIEYKETEDMIQDAEIMKPSENDDDFVLIKPQKARGSELKVSVFEAGEIRLNLPLFNLINNRKIEVYLSRNYKKIRLKSGGDNAMAFTKAGTAKNREIVEMLKELNVEFPIVYTVLWNEKKEVWEGKLKEGN